MTTRPPLRLLRVLFITLILIAAAYAIVPDEPTAQVPPPNVAGSPSLVSEVR